MQASNIPLRIYLLALFTFLFGCSSLPPVEKPSGDGYLIIMGSQEYEPDPTATFLTSANACDGRLVQDQYVLSDINSLYWLGQDKDFLVFRPSTPAQLWEALDKIATLANNDSRTIFAYSGEGNKTGLVTGFCRVPNGILPGTDRLITPDKLLTKLSRIKGHHALLISACESGCFVNEASRTIGFKGVAIGACDVGYSTTPCESEEHTALMTAFLGYYQDRPAPLYDLAELDVERTGKFINNYRHLWVDFWQRSGLPISYRSVKYVSGSFIF